jgi:hypothetical protein
MGELKQAANLGGRIPVLVVTTIMPVVLLPGSIATRTG